jgi:glycosyltransferase involved in cell wall biosynthesis
MLYLETCFSHNIVGKMKERRKKLVGIVMHETYKPELQADAFVCPSASAWAKVEGRKYYLFLPISVDDYPYKRRQGKVFLSNLGYGGVNDRRQFGKVVKAFSGLKDPKAKLIVNTQVAPPVGVSVDDPRIEVRQGNKPLPKDIYEDGDISILPIAYGGYERGILESMASGLPCLTMDADPMNLFQFNPDFLIKPDRYWILDGGWVRNTLYAEASAESIREKMEWLLTIDTEEYSQQARRMAEAQSWESRDIDYVGEWSRMLEDVCS